MGVEVPKDKMDGALEDLEGSLKLIEEKFIGDKPFIAGEQISLADLVAIVEIMQVNVLQILSLSASVVDETKYVLHLHLPDTLI